MRVFISWSGPRSRRVALGLRDWLPMVFPTIAAWMSSADIRAGSRWTAEVGSILEQSHFGVLCLSRQNLDSSWLHFEAGALSKSLSSGRLVPYLIDLEPSEIQAPLGLFQAVRADQEGTMGLVSSIASLADTGQRTPDHLARSFKLLWPEMLQHLNKARATPDTPAAASDAPDLEQLTQLVQQTAARELAVDQEDLEQLRAQVDQSDVGLVKLYGRPDALEKVGVRGGGAYFDFISHDQQYGYGSDIALQSGQLRTGFAGADYGFFLRLGRNIPFSSLVEAGEKSPPPGLAPALHEAWRQLWKYRPPADIKEIRAHQHDARGKIVAGVPVSEKVAVEQNGCYLLRSIQIDRHDILVGLAVHRILSDRSCLLAWKILQHYDTLICHLFLFHRTVKTFR